MKLVLKEEKTLMKPNENIYKSYQHYSKVPTCTFNISYFKKLYNILTEINKEAADIAISELEKQPNQTDEEFNEFKKYVRDLYKINIQIIGSNGEHLISDDKSIFDESKLPDKINKIIMDNSSYYKFDTDREPINKIVVEFDFRQPSVWNLTNNPSNPTNNDSSIQVIGCKQTWVDGAFKKVYSSLENRKNKRGWIHGKNVYDFLLWFLYLPFLFWNIYKIEQIVGAKFLSISTVFQVFIYIYTFIIALFIFNFFFKYSRWILPYLELKTTLKRKINIHKIIFSVILLPIVIKFIRDGISIVLKIYAQFLTN